MVERRLMLQVLEPGRLAEETPAEAVAARIEEALELLKVTDLALGWRVEERQIQAVRGVVGDQVTLWRWVPMFVDLGDGDRRGPLAAGPDGRPAEPFKGLPEFRFRCLDREDVVERSVQRATRLAGQVGAAGVFLDRIRWPSPCHEPASLCCFCPASRAAARSDGLDLLPVAEELRAASGSLTGRRALVTALLGRDGGSGRVGEFLRWRTDRVTNTVRAVTEGLAVAGLRCALDVFTPALAAAVGQDLAALGRLGEWAKSMTYLDAMGPAAMPYELRGLAAWLEEAGDTDAAGFLEAVVGFRPPGVIRDGERLDALAVETARLLESVPSGRAVVGIDAVELPGVCEVAEEVLEARVRWVRDSGAGLSPSWELLAMSPHRLRTIARAWRG